MLKSTIERLQYEPTARALTLNQLLEMANQTDLPQHCLMPVALLYLKAKGTQWALNKIKNNDEKALLSLAERRIKSLVANSQDSFQNLLKILRGEFSSMTNSSKNLVEQRLHLLMQQEALLELMWEQLTPEKQQEFMELFETPLP